MIKAAAAAAQWPPDYAKKIGQKHFECNAGCYRGAVDYAASVFTDQAVLERILF